MYRENFNRKVFHFLLIFLFSTLPLLSLAQPAYPQESDLEKAKVLNQQVLKLHGQGRYEDAIPIAEKVLAIREKALGPDHPDVARSLNNLALLYDNLREYLKAEPLYKRALAIWEKSYGPDHSDVALTHDNLAALYRNLGDSAKAELLIKRATAIREQKTKTVEGDLDEAKAFNRQVLKLHNQGRYEDAIPIAEKVLAIREKALGPEHIDVAQGLNNLAELYRSTGDYSKAEPLFKRALAIDKKALGPGHPRVGNTLYNLGMLYKSLGNYSETVLHFEKALAIGEKTLGLEHPGVVTILKNLAELYKSHGEHTKAEMLLARAEKEKALKRAVIEKHLSGVTDKKLQSAFTKPKRPTLVKKPALDQKTPASGPQPAARGALKYPYSLHLASFRTLERANKAITLYSKKSLSPYWVKVDLQEKGVWYRVFTGHFENRQQAERFRQNHGLTDAMVRKTQFASLIGIYTSTDELEPEIAILKNLGYSPYVIEDPVGNSRLLVGAFSTKTGALKQCADLKSDSVESRVVKR